MAAATAHHPARLSGSSLYVYSFLDVREDGFTPKVLDQFDADLTARLSALNISSHIFRFNQSTGGEGRVRREAQGRG